MAKTVLVIEDDAMLQKMYFRMLKRRYEVEVAYDGAVGLEMIKKLKPDLVFLDLNLPKLSGRQVLEALHESGWLKELPVVVLTNEADGVAKAKALEMGARELVNKVDLELETLLEIGKKYLGE